MCGRFCIAVSPGEVAERYGIFPPRMFGPRYNITPGQMILTLTGAAASMTEWGIQVGKQRICNIRRENILEKPAFHDLFLGSRCLIPASGYYEWKHEGSRKIPYYFTADSLFSFAGVLQHSSTGWQTAILTIQAVVPYSAVHARMPVILAPGEEQQYLSGGKFSPATCLRMYPVSSRVNSTTVDDPYLITPVSSACSLDQWQDR